MHSLLSFRFGPRLKHLSGSFFTVLFMLLYHFPNCCRFAVVGQPVFEAVLHLHLYAHDFCEILLRSTDIASRCCSLVTFSFELLLQVRLCFTHQRLPFVKGLRCLHPCSFSLCWACADRIPTILCFFDCLHRCPMSIIHHPLLSLSFAHNLVHKMFCFDTPFSKIIRWRLLTIEREL